MGEATMTVKPNRQLKPFALKSFGKLENIKGVSVCTFLADRQVAERQAKAAKDYLAQNGFRAEIQVVNDQSNPIQKGSSIVLWAETDNGVIIGADAIGELRKMAEAVGKEARKNSYTELSVKPTVDVYLGRHAYSLHGTNTGKISFSR